MTKTNDPRMSSKRYRARVRSHQTQSMSMAERARLRPMDYESLSSERQWEIDRELGILDWDGKEDS